jgi:ribosomal protein S18 acetylase RimI-like enzyme
VGIIEDVIVTASHRDKGIGRQLIGYMEASAAKKGFKLVKLLSDKTNTSALQFYHSTGFAQTHMMMLRRRLQS